MHSGLGLAVNPTWLAHNTTTTLTSPSSRPCYRATQTRHSRHFPRTLPSYSKAHPPWHGFEPCTESTSLSRCASVYVCMPTTHKPNPSYPWAATVHRTVRFLEVPKRRIYRRRPRGGTFTGLREGCGSGPGGGDSQVVVVVARCSAGCLCDGAPRPCRSVPSRVRCSGVNKSGTLHPVRSGCTVRAHPHMDTVPPRTRAHACMITMS